MREIGIKGVDGEHHLSIIRVHENLVHYPSNNISSILKHQGGGGGGGVDNSFYMLLTLQGLLMSSTIFHTF